MRNLIKTLMSPIILALLVVGVLFPYSPSFEEVPSADSGVFLYVGTHILKGAIPYRDVWDHKPPVIYYINALGLLVGRGSIWGVWFLELLSLGIAALLGFTLLNQAWGILPAIFGSVTWLLSLALVLDSGNYAEEFALPLQFATLYLFWSSEKRGQSTWRGLLIGVGAALCFLLRPNLVGAPLSIAIVILLTHIASRRWRQLGASLAWLGAGALSVIFLVSAYFAAHGTLESFFDQAIRYNFAYSTATLEDRLNAIGAGYRALSASGLPIAALIAWILGLASLRHAGQKEKRLLAVALVDLPLELILASASGRSYIHYYVAWLPVSSILVSWLIYRALALVRWTNARRVSRAILFTAYLALLFLTGAQPVQRLLARTSGVARTDMQQIAEYVQQLTAENQSVLFWGDEARLNFVTGRQSPTRFVYQQPLYTRGYQTPEMVETFLRDITANRPALIIDTSPTNVIIPPIDPVKRESWAPNSVYHYAYRPLSEMRAVFEYIGSHYQLIGTVGQQKWLVYRDVEGR